MLHVIDQNVLLRPSEQKTLGVIRCSRFASEYWSSKSPVALLVTLLRIMENTVKLYLLYMYNKYNTLSHNCNISCKVPDSCPCFYINVFVCRGLFEFYVFYYSDKCPNSREAVNCLGNHCHPTSWLLTLPPTSSLLSFYI